jgi:hypothetical protein
MVQLARTGLVVRHWAGIAHPNPAVNTDAHRRGFAPAGVAGYLTRYVAGFARHSDGMVA